MTFKPSLRAFLSTCFSDSEPDSDKDTAHALAVTLSAERRSQIIDQLRSLLDHREFSLEELGTEANRWFGDLEEASTWLRMILDVLESDSAAGTLSVKDSNGALLSEGDSVLVIKDLKVKGGSGDLKRGTLIKKIHLVGDPEVIECRVDGSTLVLKTCFLKKA